MNPIHIKKKKKFNLNMKAFILLIMMIILPFISVLSFSSAYNNSTTFNKSAQKNSIPSPEIQTLGLDNSMNLKLSDDFDRFRGTKLSSKETSKLEADFQEKFTKFFSQSGISSIHGVEDSQNIRMDIMVLFQNYVSKKERIEILEKYSEKYEVNFNYNIIPAVSIRIPFLDLKSLISDLNQITEIRKIGDIDSRKMETPQISSLPKETLKSLDIYSDANWSAEFSYNNWWLEAVGALDLAQTGKGVKISIIDTGISVHPDFYENGDPNNSRIVASKNFTYEEGISQENYTLDGYGHGTHAAGIAAGNGHVSDGGYRGVAPNASIINAKASNSSGFLDEDQIIAAVEWSYEQGADIISMSFGDTWPEPETPEALAIKNITKQGVVAIASAGNSGSDFFTGGSPAAGTHVISVGASDINDHVTSFSSVGPTHSNQLYPDVIAPGQNIIAPLARDSLIALEADILDKKIATDGYFSYVSLSGTSMAGPLVAGAAALLLEKYPNANPETIRIALVEGANQIERLTSEGYGNAQGAGLINVSASLEYLDGVYEKWGDVNWHISSFPKKVPYAPYDFLRFPGDAQQLNITLLSGNQTDVNLEFPDLQGVVFESEYSSQSVGFSETNTKSISIKISILYNATPGIREDYINIIHGTTGEVLNQILVNFSVALPEGKVLFDSYHGMNDMYPNQHNLYNQINLYHAMYDLYQKNFSLDFDMQNWTADYDYETDAQILNSQKLSNIDLLVLQVPILPYSDYEVAAIKDYFNNGGSILFLGTKLENMNKESINDLFNELQVDIQLDGRNLFDYIDYGVTASYSPKNIVNYSSTSPIFSGVDGFQFGFGSSFELGPNAEELFSYEDKILGAEYSANSSKGKLVSLGDYHLFRDSFYNSPSLYENHSRLWENLIQYLTNNTSKKTKISIELENRELTDGDFSFSVFPYNNSDISEENMAVSGLTSGADINASLIFANETQKIIALSEFGSTGMYQGLISLDPIDGSNKTHQIMINTSINQEFQSQTAEFFFYPESVETYNNLTAVGNNITRDTGKTYDFVLNMTDSGNYQLESYFAITTNSFLSKRNISSYKKGVNFNGTDYLSTLTAAEIETAGLGTAYATAKWKNSQGNYSLDLTPDRYLFKVRNFAPQINVNKSNFGGISFSETQLNGSLLGLTAQPNAFYPISLFSNESVEFEDDPSDLTVIGSFFQVYAYGGYIHLMSPNYIPRYPFVYNETSESFYSIVAFPGQLNFSRYGETITKTTNSDLESYYSLLIVTVTDKDGGYNDFYFLIVLSDEGDEGQGISLIDYWPLFVLGAVVVVICVVLNRKGKKNEEEALDYMY